MVQPPICLSVRGIEIEEGATRGSTVSFSSVQRATRGNGSGEGMLPKMHAVEYVHQGLKQEITAIGGHYVLVKETRLPYDGREVLYLVGHAAFDTSCCGPGGCAYALVPGFVASWHSSQTEDGPAISQLEPIEGADTQKEIRRLIQQLESVQQVIFP